MVSVACVRHTTVVICAEQPASRECPRESEVALRLHQPAPHRQKGTGWSVALRFYYWRPLRDCIRSQRWFVSAFRDSKSRSRILSWERSRPVRHLREAEHLAEDGEYSRDTCREPPRSVHTYKTPWTMSPHDGIAAESGSSERRYLRRRHSVRFDGRRGNVTLPDGGFSPNPRCVRRTVMSRDLVASSATAVE